MPSTESIPQRDYAVLTNAIPIPEVTYIGDAIRTAQGFTAERVAQRRKADLGAARGLQTGSQGEPPALHFSAAMKADFRLEYFTGAALEITEEMMKVEARISKQTVDKLWAHGALDDFTEAHLLEGLVKPITEFLTAVYSFEELVTVVGETGLNYKTPKFKCFTRDDDSSHLGGTHMTLTEADRSGCYTRFAVLQIKTAKSYSHELRERVNLTDEQGAGCATMSQMNRIGKMVQAELSTQDASGEVEGQETTNRADEDRSHEAAGIGRRNDVHVALGVFPGHFFPGVLKEDNVLYMSQSDLVDASWQGTERRADWRDMGHNSDWPQNFLSVYSAWFFVAIVERDRLLYDQWAVKCPEQMRQVEAYINRAGEAYALSNSQWSRLSRFGAGLPALVLQLLATLFHPVLLWVQWWALMHCSVIKVRGVRGNDLVIEECEYIRRWQIPWTLPAADRFYISATAETLIYTSPPIVVKIFFKADSASYDRERRAYERLGKLDYSAFPLLYAWGRCSKDGRRFLILSNEGTRVETVTEMDKATLQPAVDTMHEAGVWHNDLHARNVVRDSEGELKIVDFGVASFDEPRTDRWKEDFEY